MFPVPQIQVKNCEGREDHSTGLGSEEHRGAKLSVPQIQEQSFGVVKIIPQERVSTAHRQRRFDRVFPRFLRLPKIGFRLEP